MIGLHVVPQPTSQAWWHTPVTPARGKLSPDKNTRPYLKNTQHKTELAECLKW
jgi:hypothetical protein